MASGLHLARFRCSSCGDCCRRHAVPLTFADVNRLERATGLEPPAFIELGSLDEVDMSGETSSLILLPQGLRIPFLARVDGACVFLGSDGLCSVHSARPAACRAFPFHATLGRRGGVRRLRVLRDAECSLELTGPSDLPSIRRHQLELERELEEHYARVREYNRMQKLRRRLGRRLADLREFFSRKPEAREASGFSRSCPSR